MLYMQYARHAGTPHQEPIWELGQHLDSWALFLLG